MTKSVAVLGGDERQICLAQLMHEDGVNVVTWGLEKGDAPFGVPLDRALETDIIVLPLPVCRGARLNLPLTDTELTPDELWGRLRKNQTILGGMTRELNDRLRDVFSISISDYYSREEVQIANAVPTAEGAIMRAMEETRHTLQGSRCLVVGYGRIGKVLAHRLHGMGARVTVAARKQSDLAWIEAFDYRAVFLGNISDVLEEFDLIFNTVPMCVLDANCLNCARSDCILIELASLPGGFDTNAVKQYNLRVIEERGLPGKVAPKSAARAIWKGIYHILEERGGL